MATYAILNMIIKADDVILQSELDYLDSISDVLGITIEDVDRMNQFCRFLPKLKLPISADAKLPLTTSW